MLSPHIRDVALVTDHDIWHLLLPTSILAMLLCLTYSKNAWRHSTQSACNASSFVKPLGVGHFSCMQRQDLRPLLGLAVIIRSLNRDTPAFLEHSSSLKRLVSGIITRCR